jgi:hypothetical protein
MKYSIRRNILSLASIALIFSGIACKRGPNTGDTIPLETQVNMADVHKDVVMDMRKITVLEAVPTSKYLYLNVREDGREYWMATSPTEVKTGEVYYYNEALIRSDFESKEMERVFDTIYLVTRIVPEAQAESLKPVKSIATPPVEASDSEPSDRLSSQNQGDWNPVQIAAILSDPASYEGQQVVVTGTCTKVNEGILNRNWVHLKDGSADDKDFVITTAASIKPGENVTMRAVVGLDRDFGAGYRYAIILEDGVLVD